MTQREIRALCAETGGFIADELEEMLEQARRALAERRKEFAETHPDAKSALQTVTSLEKQLTAERSRGTGATTSRLPENPVYLRLQDQLQSARSAGKKRP